MSRIAIVDDDPLSLQLVGTVLSRVGFEVTSFNSGPQLLQQIDRVAPDLLVLDVAMPEMDGYQVCRRVRQNPRYAHLPILMLTAKSSLEQKLQGFEAGTDDYLGKPFEPRELEARVRVLLSRQVTAASIGDDVRATGPVSAKTIAVFSLRGGVGVSTLAVNVALGLAQLWPESTALVDMVFECGDAALLADMPLRNTWADVARFSVDELTHEVLDQVLLRHLSGLGILAAPGSAIDAETIELEHVEWVLDALQRQYQYVVVDLPHNFRETTLCALDAADQIVLVAAPELASVYALRRTLDVFAELEYPRDKTLLVLNWTFERHGIAREDIERVVGHPVQVVLPHAPDPIVQAINRGQPPVFAAPKRGMGAVFEDLAYRLSSPEDTEAVVEEEANEALKRVLHRQRQRAG